MKHKSRSGKQYRLRPAAASAVEQWASLTGKSESEIVSFVVDSAFAMINGDVPAGAVSAHLKSLCEVEKVRRINQARLREAQSRVVKVVGRV